MKKAFSILLMLCLLAGIMMIPVHAQKADNIVPENNSTFETGTHDWTNVVKDNGGTISVTDNPDGKGKVLAFTNIPEKSWASPTLDIRTYIQGVATKPAVVYGTVDVYSKDLDAKFMIRLRTDTVNGFSMCKTAGSPYCNIVTGVSVESDEWTTIRFQMDITADDLKSTEKWNICFDSIYNNSTGEKPEAFYIDNFTLRVEELSDEALAPRPNIEDIENKEGIILAQTSANFIEAKNSTFGAGTSSWSALGGGDLTVTDNPNGEGKVLEYTEIPEESWASPWFDIRPSVLSKISEPTTIYGSIDVYSSNFDLALMIRLRTNTANGHSKCAADGKNYSTLTSSTAVAGEWTRITFELAITKSDLASTEPWHICFDGIFDGKAGMGPDAFYIDNFYIGLASPDDYVEKLPIPEKTPIERNEKTLVGTIRWDAFTESTKGSGSVSSQVAEVLSPKKYHCQAPFFANIEADDTISFPKYTVSTWEQEAQYAVNGGIDYFAYLWYDNIDAMSQPRKMHLKSNNKNMISMAGILERLKSTQTMNELYDAMKDTCYLKLSGRPVVFLYGLDDWTKEDVEKLRQGAANAGIKKALYIVGMSMTIDFDKFKENADKDIDAISWYSVSARSKGESFETLAKRCEDAMATISGYCLIKNIDLIPAFTAGRDTRARIETGVSWVEGDPNAANDKDKPYKNLYALSPTMAELQKHMTNIISFAKNNPLNCKSNMVCSYGWNEHEEGGWLCPTLLCDENGNLILDENGNKQVNTERLNALYSALDSLGMAPEIEDGVLDKPAKPTQTPVQTPAPTEKPNQTKASFDLWWIIPVAVVVVGGVAAVAIILIKKKKAEKTEE